MEIAKKINVCTIQYVGSNKDAVAAFLGRILLRERHMSVPYSVDNSDDTMTIGHQSRLQVRRNSWVIGFEDSKRAVVVMNDVMKRIEAPASDEPILNGHT